MLNENRGHAIGDEALHLVADALLAAVPADATLGRYGPDEFLVFVGSASIGALEPAVQDLRSKLLEIGLESDNTDRLPITISAGIATYPDDGGSLAAVLSVLFSTLEGARSSGGDDVRVARLEREEQSSGQLRRPARTCHRNRHEGPLHQASLRGCRSICRLPGASDRRR